MSWLEQGKMAKDIKEVPVLNNGTDLVSCLVRYLPREFHAEQFAFPDSSKASIFVKIHRDTIVSQFRQIYLQDREESHPFFGFINIGDEKALVLFRQQSDTCSLFFIIRHQVSGSVVNLLTHKWFLFNRLASPDIGREMSDQDYVREKNYPSSSDEWKNNPKWGVLGVWHMVHSCSFYGNGPVDCGAANSELQYFEKIIHVETLKEAMRANSDGLSPSHPYPTNTKGAPAVSPPEAWL